ncbi:MAG: tRNA pseudouridine(38-40) synthase TruA [Bacteroidota bacterium]
MPTYRLLIEYDGTDFRGWQIQPDQPTVQAHLEEALGVCLRRPTAIVGSGRTDSGVHARGQVAHFQTPSTIDLRRTVASLNGLLPRSIAVVAGEATAETFHARYDARRRRYHYQACTRPTALDRHARWLLRPAPDFERMNEAAEALLGTQNYDAFCRTQSATTNRVCTVYRAAWVPDRAAADPVGAWRFEVEADRFLHGMVRALVGTLVEIGRGARPLDDLPRILASRDRREAGPAAPPHGLILHHVTYDTPFALS